MCSVTSYLHLILGSTDSGEQWCRGKCHGAVLYCNMLHFCNFYKGMLVELMLGWLSMDTNDLNQGFKECGHTDQNTANLA